MSRETENALLLLVGVSTLIISVTGTFTRYVKPSLLPWLMASAVLLIVLALVSIARDIRSGPGEDGHAAVGARIDISAWAENDRVMIRIADNGPGIGADLRGKVFEPFFTTKPVGQGTGLGLNISKVIMEQQSGGIGMVSQEGVGSTFFVEFPVAEVNDSLQDQPAEIAS